MLIRLVCIFMCASARALQRYDQSICTVQVEKTGPTSYWRGNERENMGWIIAALKSLSVCISDRVNTRVRRC